MRGIIKKMRFIDHCPTLTTHSRQMESMRVLKNEILVVEEKERRPTDIMYSARRDVDQQLIYKYMSVELAGKKMKSAT